VVLLYAEQVKSFVRKLGNVSLRRETAR